MISKTSRYAIRAVLHLGRESERHGGFVRAAEIARGLDLPGNYLSKILYALVRSGVLESERGPRGGFRLARPVEELSLAEVVEAFDPVDQRRACLLGRSTCSDDEPCRLHEHWKAASDPMIDFFKETKIVDVLEQLDLGE